MKDYAGATDTLNKTAKIFAKDESKFINCKLLAAEIYSRKLKDDYSELKAYEEIIAKYPSSAQAAKALYEAGMINERLANYQKAKELYQKLIISRPADAYATKAQRRVNKIEKQLAATQTAPQTGQIKKPAEAETEEEDIEILEELK